jgi:predicted N-acetyltransferase YhbS
MTTQSQSSAGAEHSLAIRRATPADAALCGKIAFEAFRTLASRHNFAPDFPNLEAAVATLSMMFSDTGFFCVVAEQDGKIIGSNCLDERGSITGVGPITIDPEAQNRSAGRQLMQAVMTRSAERNSAGIRLVQAGYHSRSLSLYAKLGLVVREQLACMQGAAIKKATPGYQVRPAQPQDLAACNDLCLRVHGHDRSAELRDAIQHGSATVAESQGRITAYATAIAFHGHAVAENNEALQALLSAATAFEGPGILVPLRNAALFRWLLDHGLQVTQTMTLMTLGLYNDPAGAYLPAILF